MLGIAGLVVLLPVSGTPAFGVEYRFYHPDSIGSNVLVTDRSGQILQRTVHRPYGETQLPTPDSAVATRHLFTGMEHDTESALDYFGARYYDPSVGRFLSTDPIVLGFEYRGLPNAYAYVDNRPTTFIDPTGEFPVNSGTSPRDSDYFSSPFPDPSDPEYRSAREEDSLGVEADPFPEPGDLLGGVKTAGSVVVGGILGKKVVSSISNRIASAVSNVVTRPGVRRSLGRLGPLSPLVSHNGQRIVTRKLNTGEVVSATMVGGPAGSNLKILTGEIYELLPPTTGNAIQAFKELSLGGDLAAMRVHVVADRATTNAMVDAGNRLGLEVIELGDRVIISQPLDPSRLRR